jgi:phage tail sheath gpL-like
MFFPTTLPTSKRRPGPYAEFIFQSKSSLVSVPNRVVVIAEKTAAGTAVVETPIQIFDEADADAKAGVGSLGALGLRKCFGQAAKSAVGCPEIYYCPIAEPGGGAKATYTITVTVTTALAGNVALQIKDEPVVVGVSAGDAQNTIAAAIKSAIDALATVLPVTAAVAANVVTITFTTKGVNGNDLKNLVLSVPGGVTVVIAAGVAGAGAASISNALAALYDKRYHGVVCSNHTTTDVAAIILDRATSWGFAAQNFKYYGLGENGTLGTAQALQAAGNDFGVLVTSAEQCPALPLEMACASMTAWFARSKPNANLDGEVLLLGAPPATYAYIDSEVESALNGGVTPLTPDGTGLMKIEELVSTQITFNGAPFEPLRDPAYSRTASFRAEQINFNFKTRFKQQTNTNDLKKRVRAMVIGLDRQLEDDGILRNVEDYIDQYVVVDADAPAGRVNVSAPFAPAGPVHQLDVVNVMYQL